MLVLDHVALQIKFGDTLKRMKVDYDFYRRVELDMTELREKIHRMFNIPADADFILTYVDEDGDVVTLTDDDDLSNAFRQCMKVVKINVQLSNNKLGVDSYAQSGGSSISTQRPTSLQTQHPYPKIKTGVVTEVSKSVLQQLREALLLHEAVSKISEGIISTAVSDPVLVDLISKTMNRACKSLVLRLLTENNRSSNEYQAAYVL
ncbi:protein JOKA2-like isoform X3 [Juglans microcarpa x Juglans regia]|uniref:protein JOKA2-like isoform X3 n=1 Tax=Juglans microcarpa x Juglans regia TaxID=2249226 RepID=UPI001B7F441C|nr:protein JOKA2-like isoform X3 [Juglans microcarpa x Juglans regia]